MEQELSLWENPKGHQRHWSLEGEGRYLERDWWEPHWTPTQRPRLSQGEATIMPVWVGHLVHSKRCQARQVSPNNSRTMSKGFKTSYPEEPIHDFNEWRKWISRQGVKADERRAIEDFKRHVKEAFSKKPWVSEKPPTPARRLWSKKTKIWSFGSPTFNTALIIFGRGDRVPIALWT